MAQFLSTYIVPIAIGAVALVLVLGFVNMMRGGMPDVQRMRREGYTEEDIDSIVRRGPYTSQRLMRLRVLLQFIAIVVIMATIWIMGR